MTSGKRGYTAVEGHRNNACKIGEWGGHKVVALLKILFICNSPLKKKEIQIREGRAEDGW